MWNTLCSQRIYLAAVPFWLRFSYLQPEIIYIVFCYETFNKKEIFDDRWYSSFYIFFSWSYSTCHCSPHRENKSASAVKWFRWLLGLFRVFSHIREEYHPYHLTERIISLQQIKKIICFWRLFLCHYILLEIIQIWENNIVGKFENI
jgi:hypothetical protein